MTTQYILKLKFILLSLAVLFTTSLYAEVAVYPSFFTKSQNGLEEFQNAPLISGNWEGRFRPYLFSDQKLKPLLSKEQSSFYAEFDFYHPHPLSKRHILMFGEKDGQPKPAVFILDAVDKVIVERALAKSTEFTQNWYLFACAEKSNGLFSFPQQTTQAVYQVNATSTIVTPIAIKNAPPPFIKCFWTNEQQLLGVSLSKVGYQLYQCDLNEQSMHCALTKALEPFVAFTDFFMEQGRAGVLGIKRGDTFRKPYILSDKYDSSIEMRLPKKLMGDVVEVEDGYFRVGLLSRYVTNLTLKPAADVIISRINHIKGKWYAIASDINHTLTLAVLENGEWQLQTFNAMPPASSILKPEEIWTTSPSGERYQSYYYGPRDAKNVVIWLHGGPQESVSPRFHPYTYQLNQMGYGVLMVNYPGSTGRGIHYEYKRDEASNMDCIRSLFQYLKQHGTERVIIWSISYADKLQKEILENNFPVSAIIDYTGILPTDTLKTLAHAKNVPYFSIRGKYDQVSQAKSPDFVFTSGGHGMVHPHDFELLFEALTPFLTKANKWTY